MAGAVSDLYSCVSGGTIAGGKYTLGALGVAINGMSAGTWLDWTNSTAVRAITDTTGPGGTTAAWLESAGNTVLTDWPGKITFDAARAQVVLVGCAAGYSSESPAGGHSAAVYFNCLDGTFTKQWNPMSKNLGHQYDTNCSIPLNGKIYRRPYNTNELYQCDLSTRTWTLAKSLSGVTGLAGEQVVNCEVFPVMGTSGSVMMLCGSGKLFKYDIAADTVSQVGGTNTGIATYGWIHYVPGGGYCVFGSGTAATSIYKVTPTGTISLITSSLPGGLSGSGAQANAPVVADPLGRAKSWLFAPGGNVWSLDHAGGSWTDNGAIPAGVSVGNTPMVAIHGFGAIVGLEGQGRANSTTSNSQVWIFKV